MDPLDAKPRRQCSDRPNPRPALVSALAIEAFALSRSTELWSRLALTVTVGVLLASLVGTRHGSERRRAACRGFTFFGWVYLLFSLSAFGVESRGFLLTTTLFDAVVHYVEPRNLAPAELTQFRQYFNQIGHSLFALLFGIAGAKLAAFLVDRNPGESADQERFTHDAHATSNP